MVKANVYRKKDELQKALNHWPQETARPLSRRALTKKVRSGQTLKSMNSAARVYCHKLQKGLSVGYYSK
jgi:hypothetical protein